MAEDPERTEGSPARETSRYSVRAVERVVDLLDTLQAASDPVSLSTLTEATDLPKSSVFRYLSTLESRGYVDKDATTGNYSLGPGLPSAHRYLEVLAARIRPSLERLRDRFGETLNFAVLDGERVLYVDIVESPRAMRLAVSRGDRDHIHSTAIGKAIAAHLPEERVREILRSSGLPARTKHTITRIDDFLRELEITRERGYAVDDEENEEGGRCVAVSLPATRIPAGISLSALTLRLSLEEAEAAAAALAEEQRRLSKRLALAGDAGS